MFKSLKLLGTLAGFGFLLGVISGSISGVIATENPSEISPQSAHSSPQFRQIEQPVENKVAVTISGLGLIGLELWWFLLSKPKPQPSQER